MESKFPMKLILFHNTICIPLCLKNVCKPKIQGFKRLFTNEVNNFPEKYSPEFESKWYSVWKTCSGSEDTTISKPFSILLPPPNITGNLHIGHALTVTIQDIIVRWHRMKGYTVMWIPGIDHAGIGAQVIIEDHFKKSKNREENFTIFATSWKKKLKDEIFNQLEKLGATCQWDKEVFTLSETFSVSVQEAFIRLFNENHIVRKLYMVNWDVSLQTAISDLEVFFISVNKPTFIYVPSLKKEVKFGVMYDVIYKLDNSSNEIVVSTTRPETILGDVALVVHPNDIRYANILKQNAINPLTGEKIPIIVDVRVDQNKGTGVMKLTPAHSFEDYKMSLTYNFQPVNIFTDEGFIRKGFDPYSNLSRYEARENILEYLRKNGNLVREYPHSMKLPTCCRTNEIIEPMLKEQWFLKCKDVAKQAVELAEKGDLTFDPPYYFNVWKEFLQNQLRQLWWGHSIPAYLCKTENGEQIWIAAESKIIAKEKAANFLKVNISEIEILPDKDVLDTWFSSGLYPLAALGWPKETDLLTNWYPMSLMETGYDILFFWVARMIMLCLLLKKTLPFNHILLHGLIMDKQGKKMSKSKNNIINPMDFIFGDNSGSKKAYGADSLRLSLVSVNYKAQQIQFNSELLTTNYKFCNKIWQAVRYFALMCTQYPDFSPSCLQDTQALSQNSTLLSLLLVSGEQIIIGPLDRWILSQAYHLLIDCNKNLKNNNLHLAVSVLQQFWQSSFCNFYLESTKPFLKIKDNLQRNTGILNVFKWVLDIGLRALHPFAPFITDELYVLMCMSCKIEKNVPTLLKTKYPDHRECICCYNSHLDSVIKTLLTVINILRSIYINCEIKKFDVHIQSSLMTPFAEEFSFILSSLCKIQNISWYTNEDLYTNEYIPVMLSPNLNLWISEQHIKQKQKKVLKNLNKVRDKINCNELLTKVKIQEWEQAKNILVKLKQME